MINADTSDNWFYDFESITKGTLSAKEFVRRHPDFVKGVDSVDAGDPSLDYID